jgi:hypothetical protein
MHSRRDQGAKKSTYMQIFAEPLGRGDLEDKMKWKYYYKICEMEDGRMCPSTVWTGIMGIDISGHNAPSKLSQES